MKPTTLLVFVSLLVAVYASHHEREPKSFYGLRRLPFYNRRRLIPSRFYSNLYYSPMWFPHQRFYRSTSEAPPPEEEEGGVETDVEKRSIRKKLEHLPKWKADIVKNLFGGGKKGAKFNPGVNDFDLDSFRLRSPGSDRNMEVDDELGLLEEGQKELEASLEDLDEGELVEEIMDLDKLIEEEEESDIEVLEEEEPLEKVRRETKHEGEEGETDTHTHEMKSSRRRRRRRSVIEETEEPQDKEEPQHEKRSAMSPYLIDEEEGEMEKEFYMGSLRDRRDSEEQDESEMDKSNYMGRLRDRRDSEEQDESEMDKSIYMGSLRNRRDSEEQDESEMDKSIYMGSLRDRRDSEEQDESEMDKSIYMGILRDRRESEEDDEETIITFVDDSEEEDEGQQPMKRSVYSSPSSSSSSRASRPRSDVRPTYTRRSRPRVNSARSFRKEEPVEQRTFRGSSEEPLEQRSSSFSSSRGDGYSRR